MLLCTGRRDWEQWAMSLSGDLRSHPPLEKALVCLGSRSRDPLSHRPCQTTANELVPDKSGTTTQPTFPRPQVSREGEVGLRSLEVIPAPCWGDKPYQK